MESVKVAVRVRPMVQTELDKGCEEVVQRVGGQPQVSVNTDSFRFNFVFDASQGQDAVFNDAVFPMLEKLVAGYNVTILAYGQTGSGKTYTMGTAYNGVLDKNAGVIPRVMVNIFQKIEELSIDYDCEVSCSFLELYQEQLYDLLAEKSREQTIVEMREDKNGVHIPDLTYKVVQSARETTEWLMRGSMGRAVASTAMNETSSRSHAIFTVTLKSIKKDETHVQTTAKLHLVDLAGSERSKKTKATGERFKEGVKINQGLLALGNVISALGTENGQNFVRYRDSKLTRLLQDSLGGNSCTLMIACVSPADYNIQETLSTLRYADRARKIKNKPVVNQDPHAAEISRLKGIIQKLRVELLAATNSGSSSSLDTIMSSVAMSAPSPRKTCNDKLYRDLQEKYRNLQIRFQRTLHNVVENEMRAHIAEVAHEKLKARTDKIRDYAKEVENEIVEHTDEHKIDVAKVCHLIEMYKGLDEELEQTVSEMNDHKKMSALDTSIEGVEQSELGEEDGAEIEKQSDVYTNKQFQFKEELSKINSQLNIKEELQQRIAENFNKMCILNESSNVERIEEFERVIRDLEEEKHELLDKLKHVKENPSAKLAEERRKRLLILEQEIGSMKTKMKQQSNMLKVREKEKVKIDNLTREIQSIKEAKVKLIRSMRQEADNFRQWKITREKELLQMRNKGRKIENEMARKEALHTKQRNVLKRKCEEAMAINKRLKDALERQSAAQAQRHKQQNMKDNNAKKIDNAVATVERELEVVLSIIDAEQTLENLMEDRAAINQRINELKKNAVSSNEEELLQLEEEREMRNAQISELQQKVCAADLDSRMRFICDSAQNMSESRAVIKHLSTTMCEMRREHGNLLNQQKVILDECRQQRQQSEQNYQNAIKRIKIMEKEYAESTVTAERQYEEKLALLLGTYGGGRNAAEEQDEGGIERELQKELFEKVENMREEIKRLKAIIEEETMEKYSRKRKHPPNTVDEETYEVLDETIDIDTFSEDTNSSDPDWHKTPAASRRKRAQRSIRSNSENETFTTAKTQASAVNSKKSLDEENDEDNSVRNMCKCKTGCQRRCGCRSKNLQCTSRCRCKNCKNGRSPTTSPTPSSSSLVEPCDADDEMLPIRKIKNSFEPDLTNMNTKENVEPDDSRFLKPATTIANSPPRPEKSARLARLTELNFVTPTSQKKFFDLP